MTKRHHITAGWGLVATIIVSAVVALPVLAGASASLKDKAHWQMRAQDFAEASPGDVALSDLTLSLVDGYWGQADANPWAQDVRRAERLTTNGNAVVIQARNLGQQSQCLAEAVYYEARSESIMGQKAVAEVVLNRVKSKHFPNTVCDVVYEGSLRTTGCQFSFSCDGSMAILPYGKSWSRSQNIATHMMMGMGETLTRRATHYHTTGVNPIWAENLRLTRQYDTHVFYRFMPRKSRLRVVSVAP